MAKHKILKVLLVGTPGAGKTTFLEDIAEKMVKEDVDTEKTIGVLFFTYDVEVDEIPFRLQIWEHNNDEKFAGLREQYYGGSQAVIILADLTNLNSLIEVKKYLESVRKVLTSNISFLVVGSKLDLLDNSMTKHHAVRYQLKNFAEKEGGSYVETDINNREIIDECFIGLVRHIIDKGLVEVVGKNINLGILVLLHSFNELSLTDIAKILKKSKATISRNTKQLRRMGLIKSFTKQDEIQPGSIKKYFYRLGDEFDFFAKKLDITSYDKNSPKDIMILRRELRKKLYILSLYEQFGNTLNNFINLIPKGKWGVLNLVLTSLGKRKLSKKWKNLIKSFFKISLNLYFLSESQYLEFQALKQEFSTRFEKIMKTSDKAKKNYVYIDMILPYLELMELEGLIDKKEIRKIRHKSLT